jgi:mannose-6-phosphate isomerase-like protein (cupin superfamily)
LLNATMLDKDSWPRYEEIQERARSALDNVIAKPWGHEYRIYCDPFFDVWRLTIKDGQSTSEHCHPRKSTALICLSGSAQLKLVSGLYALGAGDLVLIGRGVFHATVNAGDEPCELIEIEVPRNKFDLVRAADAYGRQASPYADPCSRQIVVPPMRSTPLVDNARYRPACASGRSRFSVARGVDVAGGDGATVYAALSLATSCALTDTITVLLATGGWPDTIDPHGTYFTMAHHAGPTAGSALTAGGAVNRLTAPAHAHSHH